MPRFALVLFLFSFACQSTRTDTQADATATPDPGSEDALIGRAASFELDTPYEPPPGDPLEHHAAGFARILCSAVFIGGHDFDFAAEAIGYFIAPYDVRSEFTEREVDLEKKVVHVTLPNGLVRTAKYYGDQGCVPLPKGEDDAYFTPVDIEPNLPDPAVTPWPMGDVLPDERFPPELDEAKVQAAVDAAFEPAEGLTAAFAVTWNGRLIGERYRDGINMHTRLESWSMGKSLTATLLGILIEQGEYALDQPAPFPEWQGGGDPRAEIRIADIMHMSSGLRCRNRGDPEWDPALGYPDHLYLYTGAVNSFVYAATRPQQWPPNTIGRYRNCDPVLGNYLVRLAVEGRGEDYLSFPQRALFDKIGIENLVAETDPYGNFLLQGAEHGTARDWARLGNLYLQDGVWDGERILPEGFVDFVSTVAPAWEADGRPVYGGFFWINGKGGAFSFPPIPPESYFMAGAGGQSTIIIPSHDLVVVRLGHYKGSQPGREGLNNALALLMEAVPEIASSSD